ncbi:MAG: oxalate/formate MFS antiporter, partial [Bradyrhizobium sp.]
MSATAGVEARTEFAVAKNRWVQLVTGVICMAAVANIQYSWTLFVPEIVKTFGWSRASVQASFTVFIVTQVLSTPVVGYLIDR